MKWGEVGVRRTLRQPHQYWHSAAKVPLVGTSLDWKAGQTCLTVFDAMDLAAGPVCEARLPQTVPLGFHGCFVAN